MSVVWSKMMVGWGLFAALSAAAAGPFGAQRIAEGLQRSGELELQRAGMTWARAEADGRVIKLFGIAPNQEESLMAEAAVNQIQGVIRVATGGIAIKPPAPDPPPETIMRTPGKTKNAGECQALINHTLNGRRLVFRHQSSSLNEQDKDLLRALAASLTECADITLIIEGHTDSTGSARSNLSLSERRAHAVKEAVGKIDSTLKVVTRPYGESLPIASNQTAEGRAANRRIDFVVAAPPAESE